MRDGAAPLDGWALFLDFDGTLVDIAPRPDAVRVEPGLPGRLAALRDRLGGALAIVTGRTVADIDGFLPGLGLDVCGLHGLERRVGGALRALPGLADLGPQIEALRAELAPHPGVLVEGKRFGVAVHWRLAPDAEAAATAAIEALAHRLGGRYRLQAGKAVRELLPEGAGKGEAIRALSADPPYAGRRPIFAGDDVTDEHGFAVLPALGGVGVKVGPGPTAARRRAPDAAAFRTWLAGFADGSGTPDDLPKA